MLRLRTHPPRDTLFPYTTLFRSCSGVRRTCGGAPGGRTDRGACTRCWTSTGSPSSPSSSACTPRGRYGRPRSEEHTSELQSRLHLVCRLLLEKKNTTNKNTHTAI